MNIKLEIEGEQFEIVLFSDEAVRQHPDGFVEDDSTWGYELFQIGEDGEQISLYEDERAAEDASEAASYAIAHLVGILTNTDDHSIQD